MIRPSEERWLDIIALVSTWCNNHLHPSERWRLSGCACFLESAGAEPLYLRIGRFTAPNQPEDRMGSLHQAQELALHPGEQQRDGAIRLPNGEILSYRGLPGAWNTTLCLVVARMLGFLDDSVLHRLASQDTEVLRHVGSIRKKFSSWLEQQAAA